MSDVISPVAANAFITSVGSIITIGGIIAFIDFFYKRRKDRFNSLFEAFTYLNSDKHREARRVLYYCVPKKANKSIIRKKCDVVTSTWIILGYDISTHTNRLDDREKLVRVSKDMVRDDMDQMGLMVKKGLIPVNVFLDRYWKSIIDCRALLNTDIAKRRQARDYTDYVSNFDYLTIRACKYAEKKDLLGDRWKKLCNFSVEDGHRIRYSTDEPTKDVEEVEPEDEIEGPLTTTTIFGHD